jgi:hypothetical protein
MLRPAAQSLRGSFGAQEEEKARRCGLFELGDEGTRTPDILLAKQALYQLSYVPGGSPVRRPKQIFRLRASARSRLARVRGARA